MGSDETVCASEAEAIAIVRLLECAGVVLQTVALRLEPDLDTVPGSSTSPLWLLKGVANINPLHTLQRALLQNVSLKEILLSAPLGSQKPNCAWLLSIISGIRSVDVDSISIWLDFQPAHDAEDIQGPLEYFFDPITCASLDEHLTAEKFKGLHDINFQLRLRPGQRTLPAAHLHQILLQRFPMVNLKRGILRSSVRVFGRSDGAIF